MTKGNEPFLRVQQRSCTCFGTIFVAFLFAASARAQGNPERVTLVAGIGLGDSWSDESRNGDGVNLFAGAELRLFHGSGILVDVSRASHHRLFDSGVRFQGSDVIASASVVGRFGSRRVHPYLLAGVSFVHSERRSEWPVLDLGLSPSTGSLLINFVGTEASRSSSSRLGPSFGGGADVLLQTHVILRTEARFIRRRRSSLLLRPRSGSHTDGSRGRSQGPRQGPFLQPNR